MQPLQCDRVLKCKMKCFFLLQESSFQGGFPYFDLSHPRLMGVLCPDSQDYLLNFPNGQIIINKFDQKASSPCNYLI